MGSTRRRGVVATHGVKGGEPGHGVGAVSDPSGGRVLVTAVAAGLVAGVSVFAVGSVVGGLVYRSGEGGWLVVAGFLLLPAVVAAGCGAIVLHYRSHPRWMRLAAALVAIGAGISLTLAQVLTGGVANMAVGGVSIGSLESRMVPVGFAEVAVGNFVLVTGLVAIAAVPVLVGVLAPGRPARRSRPWHLAAGAGWLAATTFGYLVAYAFTIRPA